ncbi:hypothetical protein GWK08_00340 [Leptobacterium flavescens]|uniref:Uncharacterized protein n=1 Tax=Leptobacterium flavescens TaxID=472055 RepID=A0A6P0UFT0_9FLAO|nr:Ig-like domain-containing protein [Leptobacterium flavescens]NER11877.1 hypothetical protein [Leptobacterium flavescens]
MRNTFYLLLVILVLACSTPKSDQVFVHSDISNFWNAYDSIRLTKDSLKQLDLLNRLFIDKASEGQKAMIEVRNYTPEEYLEAIESYPEFWESIRPNTLKAETHNKEIEKGILKLKDIYPDLQAADIYYTMGVFRSPGTGFDNFVLIGSEFALGDLHTQTKEFTGARSHIKNYYKIDPEKNIQFLSVHEYVHTQQKDAVNNILSQCLREGVADFVASLASGQISPFPAFVFGPAHNERVRAKFEDEMFNFRAGRNWFWNDDNNEFGASDMGYYVGYAIAKGYYEKASDKALAIKEMIELDYTDEPQVEKIVDGSAYFTTSLEELFQKYEAKRPQVVGVEPMENHGQSIDPKLSRITIEFSEPMDQRFRNFDYGPLGQEASIQISNVIGFSKDRKSLTFEIQPLESDKQYQLTIGNGFMNDKGFPLKPYLIDFKTGTK